MARVGTRKEAAKEAGKEAQGHWLDAGFLRTSG